MTVTKFKMDGKYLNFKYNTIPQEIGTSDHTLLPVAENHCMTFEKQFWTLLNNVLSMLHNVDI